MTKGPIIIIEDDAEDREIYTEVLQSIGVTAELRFFENAESFLHYLGETDEQPFLVLSDINMPGMSGFDLKRILAEDAYLQSKGIPFIFLSTNSSKAAVRHAHALGVQGYFEKPHTMPEIRDLFRKIFDYWHLCRHMSNT